MIRNYINQSGDSNKFWTIEQSGNSYTVTWGKIGTEGRANTKLFNSNAECSKELEKLIKEKISKGYKEVSDITQIQNERIDEHKPMDEEIFWEIIKSFNWDKTGDDAAVLRPAVKRLASMTVEDIYKFDDILSEKLY